MFTPLLAVAILSLTLPFNALASTHGAAHHRRHEEIADSVNNATEHTLNRRGQTYNNARLTYFDVGL